MHTTRIAFPPFLLAACVALALSACGGGASPEEAAAHGARTSSAGLPAGRIAEGEQKALAKGQATGQSCIDCHGEAGNNPLDPTYPKIGGQYRDYLAHTLQQYRDGGREHALMSQQARGLTDQQIADLSAYFASQPSQLSDLVGAH